MYKVRLWVENGNVMCCSGVCTKHSCARINICKDTYIAEVGSSLENIEDDYDELANQISMDI